MNKQLFEVAVTNIENIPKEEIANHFSILNPNQIKITKNNKLAFLKFNDEYSQSRAISLNNSFLMGKVIQVTIPKQKQENKNKNKNNKKHKNEKSLIKLSNGYSTNLNPLINNNQIVENNLFSGQNFTKRKNTYQEKIITKKVKKLQKIKYHIVFCLDTSGSMSGSRWNSLVVCFNNFIQKRKEAKCWDIISIILYEKDAHKVCVGQKIKNNSDFSQYLQFKNGGTNYANALIAADEILKKNNNVKRTPVLVFLSDGEDDKGDYEMNVLKNNYSRFHFKSFFVCFCSEYASRLQTLAKIGGGTLLKSSDQFQLQQNFMVISTQLTKIIQTKIINY